MKEFINKNSKKIKYMVLILAFVTTFIITLTKNYITLTLNNPKYEIEVFSNYEEKGVVCKEGNPIKGYHYCQAKIIGEVNPNKVGIYDITYQYKNKKIKKTVMVKDNINPEIIVDEKSLITCPNDKPNLEYTANDNYDGIITDKVTYDIINDQVILSVTDSSNNKTTINKNIIYQDIESPNIILNGDNPMYLLENETYKEPGYTIKDNCDNNIQNKIKIINNIDNKKEGKYQVIYTVTDNNNNTSTKKREVIVIKKYTSVTITPEDKTIYLTFDDGPGQYTEKLLNILKKYNVKATFFVTNQFPKYKNLIKKTDSEGHTVALHTYTHQWSIYKSQNTYFDDLNKISKLVKEQTGKDSRLIRFPGGSGNTVSYRYNKGIMTKLTSEVEKRGYKYFDWNIDSGDTNTKNTNIVINNVINSLKNNKNRKVNIILMHDIKSHSVDAVSKIIEYGLANDYKFAKLEETSPTIKSTIRN